MSVNGKNARRLMVELKLVLSAALEQRKELNLGLSKTNLESALQTANMLEAELKKILGFDDKTWA